MKHAGAFALRDVPLIVRASGRRTRRRSIFAGLIEALHLSRRRQARNLIRQYRHLLAEDFHSGTAGTANNSNNA